MSQMVQIKHLENPNMTTFVNGKTVTLRNHQAIVDRETAKAMMLGPFGYELVGVYDDFLEYVSNLEIKVTTRTRQGAPLPRIFLGTPLAGHKLYSWQEYTSSLLQLQGHEQLHLVFTIDAPDQPWKEQVISWCKEHEKDFAGYTIIEWDHDAAMAWNYIFKITVGRQLVFNFVRQNTDYTHLFFVDSDILLPNHALKSLLAHNRDHCAGLYNFKFVDRGGPVAFELKGKNTWPPTGIGEMVRNIPDIDENPTAPHSIELDWTGGGCLLLSKRIVDECNFNWSKWIQRHGEDAYICLAAQKLTGKRLLMDLTVKCKHMQEDGTFW